MTNTNSPPTRPRDELVASLAVITKASNMKRGIYGIIDALTQDLVGNHVQLHKADAPAIRFFANVASMDNSDISRNPKDYALVRFGWLTEDLRIEPGFETVITGEAWANSFNPQMDKGTK